MPAPPTPNELIPNFRNAAEVTPDNAVVLSPPALALYIGTAGDVAVTMFGGQDVTFTNHPVGWLPISVTKVLASTAAADIIAVW